MKYTRRSVAFLVAALSLSFATTAPAPAQAPELEKIVSNGAGSGAFFGEAVDMSGEWLVCGAPHDDTSSVPPGAGVAYFYRYDGDSLLEELVADGHTLGGRSSFGRTKAAC